MGSDHSARSNTVLKGIDVSIFVNKRFLGQKSEISAFARLQYGGRNSKSRSGAALMLALWALFMLSAMVISWASDIQSRLSLSSNANRVLSAEAMACSGADRIASGHKSELTKLAPADGKRRLRGPHCRRRGS